MDAEGEPTTFIPLGGLFRARIDLDAEKPITYPAVTIGIDDTMGQRLLSLVTPLSRTVLERIDGPCEVECRVASFPLAPGEYWLKLGLAAADAILVDARHDLMPARQLCQLLRRAGPQAPVFALMTEGGLAAVTAEWGADDVVLCSAGPAEFEARLRLAIGRQASAVPTTPDEIRSGELSIDEATYTARLRARGRQFLEPLPLPPRRLAGRKLRKRW